MTAESQDGEIRKLWTAIAELQTASPLEHTAVRNGRLRFINGLLLLEAGSTLTVIGHFNGSGDFVWSGPWAFTGPGEITGSVEITGNLELLDDGRLRIGDVLITPEGGGRIEVGTGIVIDASDNKIYVGTGGSQVVIDGSSGKIEAGDLTIDPAEGGGAVVFANGAQLYSHSTGNQIELFSGNSHVTVRDDQVTIGSGASPQGLVLDATGIRFVNLGTYTASTAGVPVGTLRQVGTGAIQRAA